MRSSWDFLNAIAVCQGSDLASLLVELLLGSINRPAENTSHPTLSYYIVEVQQLNRPLFAGGSKVSMDGAYGKK
jgi:hypothetical protein